MKYIKDNPLCDYLPRTVKNRCCQALDEDGNLCKNKAFIETIVHSDDEIQILWVCANICKEHSSDFDIEQLESS